MGVCVALSETHTPQVELEPVCRGHAAQRDVGTTLERC